MESKNIIGLLGLTLMSLLAILYWRTDVTIFGHIYFSFTILGVGIFTSYMQTKWKKEKKNKSTCFKYKEIKNKIRFEGLYPIILGTMCLFFPALIVFGYGINGTLLEIIADLFNVIFMISLCVLLISMGVKELRK